MTTPALRVLAACSRVKVRGLEIVPPGHHVWGKGTSVVAIVTPEDQKTAGLFGLCAGPPEGCDTLFVSLEEYDELQRELKP